jgi:hypothetical protein
MGALRIVVACAGAAALGAGCGRFGFDDGEHSGSADGSVGADRPLTDASQPVYAAAVLGSAPYSYYRLDDASCASLHDSGSRGFDTACDVEGGTASVGAAGALAGAAADPALAITGDGTPNLEAFVAIAPDATLWAGDFTVEAFVKPTGLTGNASQVFVLCDQYNRNGFRSGWDDMYTLQAWTSESGEGPDASGSNTTTGSAIDAGNWNHIALVHTGTLFELFLNASMIGSNEMSYAAPNDDMDALDCAFGAVQGTSSNAVFDELAIYDRALSGSELAAHYAASQ